MFVARVGPQWPYGGMWNKCGLAKEVENDEISLPSPKVFLMELLKLHMYWLAMRHLHQRFT